MKAIISDIHANVEAFQAVLKDMQYQGATEIICLGDFVGYGPNPKECIDLAVDFDVALRGNHEHALLTEREGANFNIKAKNSIEWTRQQLNPLGDDSEANTKRWNFLDGLETTHTEGDILYVHGTPRDAITEYLYPRDIYDEEKLQSIFAKVDWLCFCGHTHVPGIWTEDMLYLTPREVNCRYHLVKKKTIINVGSVGQPRDGDTRATYVLFDGSCVIFRKVAYRVETTARKIRSIPQLDPYLAQRLLDGR
ncbi:MAG: metallophosphoesterase family protein [Candidatus Brocadiae bacterium]|nr:metallophosphoesterase family protein [Candidatus Brocadiia bacterium]